MTSEVDFHLHDPAAFGEGQSLLDVLVNAASGASRGGGIFAFASRTGIEMLLEDEELRPMLDSGGFELIVGVDSVTDVRALERLSDLARRRSALDARVLVHGKGGLFHPKLCWFRHGDRLRLVVGSGNLTLGGLTRNTEASTVAVMRGGEAASAEARIRDWIERWHSNLLVPDDPVALAAAAENSGSERSFREKMQQADERVVSDDVPAVPSEAAVLALDVSKNVAQKRTQLEVGKEKVETYFGGVAGNAHRVLIQPVTGDGGVGAVEPPRALISSKSSNFRIELGAGHGRDYPQAGRPIALFVKGGDAIFRYRLLWPDDPGHVEADAFLTALAGRTMGGNMRRETATVADLREAWPDSPLLAALS